MTGVIVEAVNVTATVMATTIVDTYKAGGNPALLVLAIIGMFAIFASTISNSSKVLSQLFIVCIAAPMLLIEFLWKKHKERIARRIENQNTQNSESTSR